MVRDHRPVVGKPIVRPVVQVCLDLTDKLAFPSAIRETVAWLAKRCHGRIPANAFEGVAFDFDDQPTANPTSVVRIDIDGTDYWAARLDYPDKDVPQRVWSTEITIANFGQQAAFKARLTNITKGDNTPWVASVPGIVRQILKKLSAEADGIDVNEHGWVLQNKQDFAEFFDLLLSPKRQLPIIAVSRDDSSENIWDEKAFSSRVYGAAHIVIMPHLYSRELSQNLGREWSVFNGNARIYWPRFNPSNDIIYKHRLFLQKDYPDHDVLANEIADVVLPKTFMRSDINEKFPRFNDLREVAVSRRLEVAASRGASKERQIEDLQAEIRALRLRLQEDENAQHELLDEAEQKKLKAEEDRDNAWFEVRGLRARIKQLESAIGVEADATDELLSNYEEFEDWCQKCLSGAVFVMPKAIKEAKRNGAKELASRVSESLLLLKNVYVPMRLQQEGYDRRRFDDECRAIGIEESACFADAKDARRFSGYYVSYKGQKRYQDRHLKYGGGTDHRSMFRIYFFWDEDDQVVVVGHLPTHLDNNVTN